MSMFGLYGLKPTSAASIPGMRLLRVKRRDLPGPSPSTAHYLRHAGALSAAVAGNMSAGELAHASSSASSLEDEDGSGLTSFMEAHAQYSFIAVVALMSLFLVITISATGLMLAFCRKKNAVFTAAPEKSDADSQLEMDDIDNSDVEMCQGDKGECYYHLSDDDDGGDDDDDDDEGEDNAGGASERNIQRIKKLSKRSRTFPQLKKILVRRRGHTTDKCKDGKMSKAAEPLVNKEGSTTRDGQASDEQATVVLAACTHRHHTCPLKEQKDSEVFDGNGERPAVCRNPNHQHYSRQHHNCLYNRPHYHHRNHRRGPKQHQHPPPYPGCGSKLHRSHTIHYIPQTQRKSSVQDGRAACGVQIKVRDMETIMAGDNHVEPAEVGTVQLHYIPGARPQVRHAVADFDHADDIFDESEANFSSLRLQVVDSERDGALVGPPSDNDKNNNDPQVLQTFGDVGETYWTNRDVPGGNYPSADSRLLSDYLTCSTGFSPSVDCIFSHDKTLMAEVAQQTSQLDQVGQPQTHTFPAAETVIDRQLPASKRLTTFHNLFPQGETTDFTATDTAPHNKDHPSQNCISPSVSSLPPPQGALKRLIHRHGVASDERRRGAGFRHQREKIISPDTPTTNQRASESLAVDVTAPESNWNSNSDLGEDERPSDANSKYDMACAEYQKNCALLLPVEYSSAREYSSADNLLKLSPGNSSRGTSASGSRDESGAAAAVAGGDDDDDEESGEYNYGDTFARVKTCDDNDSDEDDEDLTLSLLK